MLEALQEIAAYAGEFVVFTTAIVACLVILDGLITYIVCWFGAYNVLMRSAWQILSRRHTKRRAEGTR